MSSDQESGLAQFVRDYEQANNSHDFSQVQPFIAPHAVFFFTDGTFYGLAEIRAAVEATFQRIQHEQYRIEDVRWITTSKQVCAFSYAFHWYGIVAGEVANGSGRGTNIIEFIDGRWQIIHEHLSS